MKATRVSIFLVMVTLVVGTVGCGESDGNGGGESYNLTIDSSVGGVVAVDDIPIPGKATLTYDAGAVVDLIATPSPDYRFVGWTGDVDTIAHIDAASTTITMQCNYEIAASFEAILHSSYKLICDIPEVVVARADTRIPVTLKTDQLGQLGYDDVQLHVRVYPRAGDVTIKFYFWSFRNELYSNRFDLPADYNQTIYPLVYFSEPGEYTFILSLVGAPYGPVIGDMTESVTVSVV